MTAAIVDDQLWSKRRELLALAVMGSIYFFSYFQRVAVPGTLFNQIQSDLHLTATGVTALGALFLYIYSGSQIFVGLTADRFGGGRVLVGGGLVMAIGSVLFPLAHTPGWLYAGRALTGLGASFMFLSLAKEVDTLFGHRHFPVLIGPVMFAGFCGGLAATAPLDWAATAWGWRPALLTVGLACGVCVGLTWLALRQLNHPVPVGVRFSLRPFFAVFRNRRSWPQLFCGTINFPVYFIIQSTIGKKLLEDVAGMTSAAAARCVFVMMGVSAGLSLVGGSLLPLTGHRRRPFLIGAPALLLAGLVVIGFNVRHGAPGWVLLVGYVLLAASNGCVPAGTSTFKELNARDAVAVSVGVINSVAYLGVAVLANCSGMVLDRFRLQAILTPRGLVYPPAAYAALIVALAGLAAASLVVSCWIPETRGQPLRDEELDLG